jgi:hypothetical protein
MKTSGKPLSPLEYDTSAGRPVRVGATYRRPSWLAPRRDPWAAHRMIVCFVPTNKPERIGFMSGQRTRARVIPTDTADIWRGKASDMADRLRETRAEVDGLKQELAAAREQLPDWAKPVMKEIAGEAKCCEQTGAAVCKWPPCLKYRNLTPDQRRQCEEP